VNPGGRVGLDSVLKDFADYLKLSMGLVMGEERKKNTIKKAVDDCLK